MADILTEGLPDSYRPYFYGRRFLTPGEWLRLALDIEADMTAKSYTRKPNPSNHCQATIKHCDQISGSKPNYKNYNKDQSKQSKPYAACRFCQQIGLTEFHWHRDCPNRKPINQDKSRETEPKAQSTVTNN